MLPDSFDVKFFAGTNLPEPDYYKTVTGENLPEALENGVRAELLSVAAVRQLIKRNPVVSSDYFTNVYEEAKNVAQDSYHRYTVEGFLDPVKSDSRAMVPYILFGSPKKFDEMQDNNVLQKSPIFIRMATAALLDDEDFIGGKSTDWLSLSNPSRPVSEYALIDLHRIDVYSRLINGQGLEDIASMVDVLNRFHAVREGINTRALRMRASEKLQRELDRIWLSDDYAANMYSNVMEFTDIGLADRFNLLLFTGAFKESEFKELKGMPKEWILKMLEGGENVAN